MGWTRVGKAAGHPWSPATSRDVVTSTSDENADVESKLIIAGSSSGSRAGADAAASRRAWPLRRSTGMPTIPMTHHTVAMDRGSLAGSFGGRINGLRPNLLKFVLFLFSPLKHKAPCRDRRYLGIQRVRSLPVLF